VIVEFGGAPIVPGWCRRSRSLFPSRARWKVVLTFEAPIFVPSMGKKLPLSTLRLLYRRVARATLRTRWRPRRSPSRFPGRAAAHLAGQTSGCTPAKRRPELLNTSTAASSPSRPGAGRPQWSGWLRRGGPTWRRGGFRRRTRPAPRALQREHLGGVLVRADDDRPRGRGGASSRGRFGRICPPGVEIVLADVSSRRAPLPPPAGTRRYRHVRDTAPRRRRGSARLGWSVLRCQAQGDVDDSDLTGDRLGDPTAVGDLGHPAPDLVPVRPAEEVTLEPDGEDQRRQGGGLP
jgi:hypothetical protein